MQLYAFDALKKLISASHAIKGQDYFCHECHGRVHRRGGFHRQDHFFHLEHNRVCRQNGKSAEHLQVQAYFLNSLPPHECLLEHSFPHIGRIGDVYWEKENIVFEVQCSPISMEEVLARNTDYASIGIAVVWILHDARYNKAALSAAEWALAAKTHYFTNIDDTGTGIIYDFFSILHRGRRMQALSPLPIDIRRPHATKLPSGALPLKFLQQRHSQWRLYFGGDVLDCYAHGDGEGYCARAQQLEEAFYALDRQDLHAGAFLTRCLRPFQILWQIALERFCK